LIEGDGVQNSSSNGYTTINWNVTSERKVLQFPSGLYVYLLGRNDAYNYWVLDLPAAAPTNAYSHQNASSVIVSGGYLMRTANITGSTLALTGDINATTTLEILGGAPTNGSVTFNGNPLTTNTTSSGTVMAAVEYSPPDLTIPSLQDLSWKYIDSAPEVQNNYSDAAWTDANLNYSNNTVRGLSTPMSLYASDYGYNVGTLVFRGYFTANGGESSAYVATQGGTATGHMVFLNDTFLGSYTGTSSSGGTNQTFTLSNLQPGSTYVLTIYVDNTGLDETAAGGEGSKNPRGILDYGISGHSQTDVTWKITGNLGGEDYVDYSRGPLNEGGFFIERQGYHLPGAPLTNWTDGSPFDGIANPGIAFYGATFDLKVPNGYNIPMAFVLGNYSTSSTAFRATLYVNGWQFGKMINTIGPQTSLPVPPGILNYDGENYVGLVIWALADGGASLSTFKLVANAQIQSGYPIPASVPATTYAPRDGAY
jgi:Beta-galactosidase jelly roll domain/Beta-galactosidase, domain 3